MFKHWSRDGILRPSQLYNNGILDPVQLLNKLTHRAGFFFEFHTIRCLFPLECAQSDNKGSIELDNKAAMLEYSYNMPDGSKKHLKDLTSRDIYAIFLNKKEPPDLSKTYWETSAFPGTDINWEAWIKYNFQNALTPRKIIDFQFKLKNNLINVETRLRRMGYSNGSCKLCSDIPENNQATNYRNNQQIFEENLSHMLISCKYNSKLWVLIEKLINQSFDENYSIGKFQILCGVFSENLQNDDLYIINMILSMTRYHIYLMRNHTKNEGKQVSFAESYIRLRSYISGHIKILLLSHRVKNMIKMRLEEVLIHISDIFKQGINENDIRSSTI